MHAHDTPTDPVADEATTDECIYCGQPGGHPHGEHCGGDPSSATTPGSADHDPTSQDESSADVPRAMDHSAQGQRPQDDAEVQEALRLLSMKMQSWLLRKHESSG